MYLIFVMNVICFVISNAVLLHNNVSYSHAALPSLGLAIMHTRKCVAFTMYLFSLKTFIDFKSSCVTHVLFNLCFYLNMTMLFLTCLLFLSAYRTTVNALFQLSLHFLYMHVYYMYVICIISNQSILGILHVWTGTFPDLNRARSASKLCTDPT